MITLKILTESPFTEQVFSMDAVISRMQDALERESTTAPISALPIRLTMRKKHQGLAIALFFSYAKRTGKTNLYAVQLQILG